jgi:hypothetical protein
VIVSCSSALTPLASLAFLFVADTPNSSRTRAMFFVRSISG